MVVEIVIRFPFFGLFIAIKMLDGEKTLRKRCAVLLGDLFTEESDLGIAIGKFLDDKRLAARGGWVDF